jgi:hypothetical protein
MNIPREAKSELTSIPGVGPSIASDLYALGIRRVKDLKRKSPERLYERLCDQRGARVDPCVLYVFRCAVYYATATRPKPELLKWWNWKDRTGTRGSSR